MIRKHLVVLGFAFVVFALSGTPAMGNDLNSVTFTATCSSFTLEAFGSNFALDGSDLPAHVDFVIDGFPSGEITGTIPVAIDASGNFDISTSGSVGPFGTGFSLTGNATLFTQSGQQETVSFSATVSCGTPTGKSFSIGPSSMEGDLHISPGDWISGGYNFKFTDNKHGATAYTVTATVTVPVVCPDNSVEKIVIPLGQPGTLDGGGVTSFTYNIAAGDTSNHPTNDQNSILAWAGAVQAPATLCGGATGRNQTGAVFNVTVSQNPHVGLVDWQFHYRDPNAKGKGNVNCTDASDPRRNDAATCGASWSQTVRDP
jgi:hypothetical protein